MYERLFKFIFVLIVIVVLHGCARPYYYGDSRSGNRMSERAEAEKILRKTEYEYRTLAVKNLTSYIRRYLGTPYRYGKASLAGTDCSGFVKTMYDHAFGIDLPRSTQQMYNETISIPSDQLKMGDLLFFSNGVSNEITHVGIYLIDTYFAHASTVKGVTISDLDKEHYQLRFIEARRVAKLELH